MKTLEVTDEQYAFIQHLREEVAESVVGKYGFVREQDAVQFLIDNFDEDVELETGGEFDSTAADDVAASVGAAIDGETDPDDLEEVSYDEGGGTDDDEPEPDDPGGSSEADDGSAGDLGDDGDGSADDDDMLDEMMSLLETHDDKWTESESADHRYTVELPDGSTEQVQTKDDVRALLFKNYR
jgi:hypothetical protein